MEVVSGRIGKHRAIKVTTTDYSMVYSIGFTVLVVLVLLLIGLYFWNTHYSTHVPSPIPTSTDYNTHRGEGFGYKDRNGSGLHDAVTCSGTGKLFTNGVCTCTNNYFGPSCDEQSLDPKYKDVGIGATGTTLSVQNTTALSYSYGGQTGCSVLCNNNTNCVGFLQSGNICTLLSNVTLDNTVFSPLHQGNSFIKDSYNPVFQDRMFLFANESIPYRFWVDNTVKPIQRGVPTALNFVPKKYYMNPSGLGSLYLYEVPSNKQQFTTKGFQPIQLSHTNKKLFALFQ